MKLYKGVVEDNKDPKKIGRVRVRIYGLHTGNTTGFDSVQTSDLPWATTMGGTEFGLVGGNGISSILRQGTWVWVLLEEENPNKPVVIGTVLGINQSISGDSFKDPDGVHPKVNGSDIHALVQEKYTTLATLQTESGHLIELDDTPGDERIKVTHTTGTSITIAPDGTMNIEVVKDLNVNVAGATNMTSGGDTTIQAANIYLN